MADSSFDIVSKIDRQEADNALNQARKEVEQRYDFKGTDASIDWSGDAILIKANSEERAKAVLDVFQTEPLPADAWFWDHPKVRVTPHASNRGELTGARGDALFLENLGRYLRGESMLNLTRPADIGAG